MLGFLILVQNLPSVIHKLSLSNWSNWINWGSLGKVTLCNFTRSPLDDGILSFYVYHNKLSHCTSLSAERPRKKIRVRFFV